MGDPDAVIARGLGADTASVLKSCGYPEAAIDKMQQDKAIICG